MSLILNIDTALETASVCLAQDDRVLQFSVNANQKDHAEWLQSAIKKKFIDCGLSMNDLSAVTVTIGPGSYTGLRVGLASAKGLCYALNIPLITISTLKVMAFAARNEEVELLCPVIDARRMEIFTAIYSKSFEEILKPCAIILDKDSFSALLSSHKIVFFGNGCAKVEALISSSNAIFKTILYNASDMVSLSYQAFLNKDFTNLAYSEPEYLKDFFYSNRKSV